MWWVMNPRLTPTNTRLEISICCLLEVSPPESGSFHRAPPFRTYWQSEWICLYRIDLNRFDPPSDIHLQDENTYVPADHRCRHPLAGDS